MDENGLLSLLRARYALRDARVAPLRRGGCAAYRAFDGARAYFVKVVGAAFADTFQSSVDVNLYLQNTEIPVPRVVSTYDGQAFIQTGDARVIVYEYLETREIDMRTDAEAVGALLGKLHRAMRAYPGSLAAHGRAYYLERYLSILQRKRYSGAREFFEYGERLWKKIEGLPRGYAHGDLYSGNLARGANGKLYVMDFDTSATGFPTYDLALIANQTDYFRYEENGLSHTRAMYARMLPEYLKYSPLSEPEKDSLCDMIALYHFALQATIIEIYGMDCVNDAFFSSQLSWLKRWENQCREKPGHRQ